MYANRKRRQHVGLTSQGTAVTVRFVAGGASPYEFSDSFIVVTRFQKIFQVGVRANAIASRSLHWNGPQSILRKTVGDCITYAS